MINENELEVILENQKKYERERTVSKVLEILEQADRERYIPATTITWIVQQVKGLRK